MSEEKVIKEEDDTIWPPPPSAPLPVPASKEPFIVRLSLEVLILLDIGMGLASGGTHCLVRLLSHKQIGWRDTAFDAVCMTLIFFSLHFAMRYFYKKSQDTASSAE